MNVLICTFADKAIEAYTQHTIPRMVQYATQWGFDFKVSTKMKEDKHPSWGKIQMILENFNQYDLIVFLDADIWINRFDFDVREIGDADKLIKICVNGDNGGKLLNCGSLIVKGKTSYNNDAYWFFTRVWATTLNNWSGFWEQDVINDMYEANKWTEQSIIQPLLMRTLNSWWMDNSLNAPDNNVYHLMGRTIEDKIAVINKLKQFNWV